MSAQSCEADSSCSEYQVAICLHCQRRLCSGHITEHSQLVVCDAQNLSQEVQRIFQQIEDESEKCEEIFGNVSSSLNQWRTQQIERIELIYEKHAERIALERKNFQMKQRNFFERLECDGRQPLEHSQKQQTISAHLLNHIRQTVEQIRDDSVQLTESLSTIDTDYSSCSSVRSMSRTNKSPLARKKHLQKVVPPRRLVKIFARLSSIDDNRSSIDSYIQMHVSAFQLPTLVCSYLTAWHRKRKIDRKVYLLNEHISTIRSYLAYDQTNIDVLIGIQAFFFHEKIQGDIKNVMTFLLQFFLNDQCINQSQILSWYHQKGGNGYQGFVQAKKLASSFIEVLSINKTIHNSQAIPISMGQYVIKQEIENE